MTQHCYSSEECKIKPQWDITSHLSEWLSSKRLKTANVGEDVDKREYLHTIGDNINMCSHYEKMYVGSSKKKNPKSINKTTKWSNNSTYTKIKLKIKILTWKYTCTLLLMGKLFFTAKKGSIQYPSTDEWIMDKG